MTCEECGERIQRHYPNGIGGDCYYSCRICDWHSEGEGVSKIRDSLDKAEIIDLKKDLLIIHGMLHTLVFKPKSYIPKGLTPETVLDEVIKIQRKLVEEVSE